MIEPRYLCADIGGTKLRACVFGDDERIRGAVTDTTPAHLGGRAAADRLLELCDRALEKAGAGSTKPAGVGVSFGGPVDYRTGRILKSHHVSGWEGFPLVERLADRYGSDVRIENDGNAAAVGEYLFGAGRGARGLLYLTVSTGVGGGIVAGDQLWRGAGGSAGEVGHVVVVEDGRPCVCGKRGCVEAYSSGTSLALRAQELLRLRTHHEPAGLMTELAGGDTDAVTAPIVFDAAASGDPTAAELVADAVRHLGTAIANVVTVLDADRVVIGGGMSREGDRLFAPLQRRVDELAMFGNHHVPVVSASLGDESGLYGAFALASGRFD